MKNTVASVSVMEVLPTPLQVKGMRKINRKKVKNVKAITHVVIRWK